MLGGFYTRKDELAMLEERFRSGRAEFLILYGRRRIGKTELILEFLKGKRHVYFEATAGTAADHLVDFSQALAEATGSALFREQPLASWRAALTAIEEAVAKEPLIVAIDEFQFVGRESPAIGSEINRFWRRVEDNPGLMLIVSGSDVGFFEEEMLAYSAVTYGRRTGSLRLRPLPLPEIHHFAPGWPAEDLVRAWAVFGGIPYYLENIDPDLGLGENILRLVLAPDGLLREEPLFLLAQHSDIRAVGLYLSTLRAIAAGRTRRNEIAQRIDRRSDQTGEILDRLIHMRLVERELPVTVANPDRSKAARYRINDSFLHFWFRFVHPFVSQLQNEEAARRHLEAQLLPQLDHFTSKPAFEEICRAWLATHHPLSYAGGWWGSVKERRSGEKRPVNVRREIDVVGLDQDRRLVALGSCKWTSGPMEVDEKTLLERLAPKVAAAANGGEDPNLYFFSRTGFSPELRAAAAGDPHCRLVELDEILGRC